jgi:hypothetical protein
VSFSTALLKVLAKRAAPAIDIEVVTLDDIPFYNEDLDIDPAIPAVAAFKRKVAASDGVLISADEAYTDEAGLLFMLKSLERLRAAVAGRRRIAA